MQGLAMGYVYRWSWVLLIIINIIMLTSSSSSMNSEIPSTMLTLWWGKWDQWIDTTITNHDINMSNQLVTILWSSSPSSWSSQSFLSFLVFFSLWGTFYRTFFLDPEALWMPLSQIGKYCTISFNSPIMHQGGGQKIRFDLVFCTRFKIRVHKFSKFPNLQQIDRNGSIWMSAKLQRISNSVIVYLRSMLLQCISIRKTLTT